MNMLPQILKIASKNLLINHFIDKFKKKVDHLFERFIYGKATHPYLSFFLELQNMNQLCLSFVSKYYKLIRFQKL